MIDLSTVCPHSGGLNVYISSTYLLTLQNEERKRYVLSLQLPYDWTIYRILEVARNFFETVYPGSNSIYDIKKNNNENLFLFLFKKKGGAS